MSDRQTETERDGVTGVVVVVGFKELPAMPQNKHFTMYNVYI